MVSELSAHTVLLTWRWPVQTSDTVTWNSETPACAPLLQGRPPLSDSGAHAVIRGFGELWLGLNFPAFCLFPSAYQKQGR